ncbi:MAG: hypothetical protein AYK19_15290 [Theionarchaea archaeon DG-70-1]|nr:MAG: hypothetical protein AYK19_15290 [Theionarchaea archaeon DG-70-1]
MISFFGKHFIKSGIFPREMGKELHRAFEKRQLSEYEYTFVISQDEAQKMLEKGENFIERIITWLKEEKHYEGLDR